MMCPVQTDFLGTEPRVVDAGRYRTRIVTAENDKDPLTLLLDGWIAYDMAVYHPGRTSKIVLNTALGMSLDPTKAHEGVAAGRLAEIIPGAKKHIMRGRTHWPQWERPEEHDEVIGAFMQG